MLEMICSIPENIGWVMVGAVGATAVYLAIAVVLVIRDAIKDRLEEVED